MTGPYSSTSCLLLPPWRDELRHVDRGRCAELVDARLRVLARREALARRVLGTVAGMFLQMRAHHRLGFARLNDYTRERLGLSARELQSVANVAAELGRLPALATAFERGEISWTQARTLVPAATPATEQAWLAAARGLTVRALEELVRGAAAGSGPDPLTRDTDETTSDAEARACRVAPPVDVASTHAGRAIAADSPAYSDDDDAIDGERSVRFRLLCPRALRPLWRATIELARRVAGEALPVWCAAEAIAAEGLSGVPPSSQPVPAGEIIALPAASACRRAPDVDTSVTLSEQDESTLAAAVPSLLPLADGLDTLDAFALDERLRAVLSTMHTTDWETGRLLRLLFDLRLHERLGFPDTGSYVRERLGFSPRKAGALVAVERATWRHPDLAEAYRAGRISWLRALLIAPVLRETTAAAWIERSGTVTVRRLTDELEWARTIEDLTPLCFAVAPPPLGAVLEISPQQLRALDTHDCNDGIDAVLTFHGPASVVALLRSAIATFTAPGEHAWHGCKRLLEHARAEWERQPRHRDPIFARDGWRCAVPACRSRRNLHDHHVVFRSRGGDNARDNRITVCAWHHLRGIHAGRVRAWGRAPEAIRWELGVRAGAAPLLALEGDRYVPAH